MKEKQLTHLSSPARNIYKTSIGFIMNLFYRKNKSYAKKKQAKKLFKYLKPFLKNTSYLKKRTANILAIDARERLHYGLYE